MAAPSVVVGAGGGGVDGGGGGGGPAGSGSGGGAGGGGGRGRVKGSWTPEEDELLRGAVARHGPRNWSLISAEIPGRSGKSCRLRWCNQLSPGVERRPFTPDEDAVIVAAHAQFGNKWATIARMLHGRTDNSVKNHWNSTLRRQRRAAAAAANAGCAALPLRPLAAVASGPPLPLRHLLLDPKDSSPAPAPASAVPFQHLDLKRGDDGDDDDEEGEEEDEDGSSEDSVLMPPPKKRTCIGVGVGPGQTHPSRGAAKKPEHVTRPVPPPTPPAPAEPVTSLTLSLPGVGVGVGGAAVPEAPAPQCAAAASMDDGVAKMRERLEQDWPWLQPVIRQMICEEVQRHLQGAAAYVPCSLADGRETAASNQDG